MFTADDVEDKGITRDLMVRLNLDYVTSLDTTPVTDLETLVALGEDEFFDWFTVDFLSRLFEFFVVEHVQAACGDDTCHGDKDDVGVVAC